MNNFRGSFDARSLRWCEEEVGLGVETRGLVYSMHGLGYLVSSHSEDTKLLV